MGALAVPERRHVKRGAPARLLGISTCSMICRDKATYQVKSASTARGCQVSVQGARIVSCVQQNGVDQLTHLRRRRGGQRGWLTRRKRLGKHNGVAGCRPDAWCEQHIMTPIHDPEELLGGCTANGR